MGHEELRDEKYWIVLRNAYLKEKAKGQLYVPESRIAPSLIVFFYNLFPNAYFDLGLDSFRSKYINNETELENADEIFGEHTDVETKGMAVMYDYIEKFEIIPGEFTIFEVRKLHKLLFAYTPFPEFAGEFRTGPVRLTNSTVKTTPPSQIVYEFFDLSDEFDRILLLPLETSNDLINYIRESVILHTKLLKIHPFNDGNGRSIRALLNLMFKKANIPPVYVEPREKPAYLNALKRAQIDNEYNISDYEEIIYFYMYKICDSLIEITENQFRNENGYGIDDIVDENGVRIAHSAKDKKEK